MLQSSRWDCKAITGDYLLSRRLCDDDKGALLVVNDLSSSAEMECSPSPHFPRDSVKILTPEVAHNQVTAPCRVGILTATGLSIDTLAPVYKITLMANAGSRSWYRGQH